MTPPSLLCAFLIVCFSASAATKAPTLAVFAGNYKATVALIQLADDSDAFVGGSYSNFKLRIKKTGRGTGRAVYHSPDGLSTMPVKIKVRVSKFKLTGEGATAEVVGVGSDGLVFFGSADLTPPSHKRNILFTFVKGDFHAFALFFAK